MENLGDYKVILYIVLAILYFLFSGKKKAAPKAPPPVRQREESQNQPPVRKPFEQRTQPVNRPTPVPASRPQAPAEPEPYSLEDILRQFGQGQEEQKQETQETLGAPKMEVPKLEVPKLVDYDEGLKDEEEELSKVIKSSEEKLVSRESLQAKQEHENKYANMLKDPEGIKTAFIASEIFNRKY